MSVRRLAEVQPESFAFTPENRAWAEREIAKYPPGRQASAIISLLWRAQAQHDYWLPKPAIETVADMLAMPYIRALEVATFYTMFNLEPVGRHHVQVCGTTPCVLRGAEEIKRMCRNRIGPEGKVSGDGKLSWVETECLGACCNAPASWLAIAPTRLVFSRQASLRRAASTSTFGSVVPKVAPSAVKAEPATVAPLTTTVVRSSAGVRQRSVPSSV